MCGLTLIISLQNRPNAYSGANNSKNELIDERHVMAKYCFLITFKATELY